jgi:hypothetical protein
MSDILIRHRSVLNDDKSMLEVRFQFWKLKATAVPAFELSYSVDGKTEIEAAFQPKRVGKDTPQVWIGSVEQRHFQGNITAKAWVTKDTTGEAAGQLTFAAGVTVSPATAADKTAVVKLPTTAPTILTTVNAAIGTQIESFAQFPFKLKEGDPPPPLRAADVTPQHIRVITDSIRQMMVSATAVAWDSLGVFPTPVFPSIEALSSFDPPPSLALLEECWAQAITEALVGIPYAGSGPTAALGNGQLFSRMADESDPIIPITGACEHLVTMALISRGFDGAADRPVGSHAGAAEALVAQLGGTFTSTSGHRDVIKALSDPALAVGPGSAYHFSESPHIAFILRTLPNQRIQFFDTGAMNSPTDPASPGALNAPHNQDYPAFPASDQTEGIVNGPASRKKTYAGLWCAPEQSPETLAKAVDRLRRSRPFGLARLVLRYRGIADVRESLLYSSPLLPMCAPILRYLFSLRNHPYCEQIEARWYIGVPQGRLATEMLASPNFADTWGGRNRQRNVHGTREAPDTVVGVVDLGSQNDGTVVYSGFYAAPPSGEFWRVSPDRYFCLNWPEDRPLPTLPDGRTDPEAVRGNGRPAVFEALPIGRAPAETPADRLEGVLAEHERNRGGRYPNKVIMDASGLDLWPYLLGTDG